MGAIRDQLEKIWAQQRELTIQAEALQATCNHPATVEGLSVMYHIHHVLLCVECGSVVPGEVEIKDNGSEWMISDAN